MSNGDWANSDQREYMNELGRMDATAKCWCGWYRHGECPNCPKELTCADKMKLACASCGSTPMLPGWKVTHTKGCSHEV